MEGKMRSLMIGRSNLFLWNGLTYNSAIQKKKVTEAMLTKDGFQGDKVANRAVHGGPDRAVCLYPLEHYKQWENEFNKAFQIPAFGENISVEHMLEQDIYIGDIFSLGDAIIQVSQGRIPCATISNFNREARLLHRVVETGFTGYLFRVLQEGMVPENSSITLVERRQNKYSVLKGNKLLFHDRKNKQEIEEFIQIKELADVWKIKLNQLV
ncbi:MOSC domain-containing protein [Bacillus sp. Bva_UNVM-123]|uniref:MOSC domain-containing protein n=1 Tax=Bacillus sp. Bva_UNVM-123 TaxID=2829798 RepID=UPI00391F26DA